MVARWISNGVVMLRAGQRADEPAGQAELGETALGAGDLCVGVGRGVEDGRKHAGISEGAQEMPLVMGISHTSVAE